MANVCVLCKKNPLLSIKYKVLTEKILNNAF